MDITTEVKTRYLLAVNDNEIYEIREALRKRQDDQLVTAENRNRSRRLTEQLDALQIGVL